MAHYALIDSKSFLVTRVITGIDEDVTQTDLDGTQVGGSAEAWEQFYAAQPWNAGLICKRTSYNNNIRKQYAGIGYTYDADADVFVRPQPFSSWTLDSNYDWQPPIPMPIVEGLYFTWFDPTQQWIEHS